MMITMDSLPLIPKEQLPEAAKALESSDLPLLVDLLSEQNDKLRYQAFLLLQFRSRLFEDVYPFWDILLGKLSSENSYQRGIGLMLITENTRWDREHKMESALDLYLSLLRDEKPITVRQCIQSLGKMIPFQPDLSVKIARSLVSLDLKDIRETMRKLVLTDILNVLAAVRTTLKTDEFDSYLLNAIAGSVLDKKGKKKYIALLS